MNRAPGCFPRYVNTALIGAVIALAAAPQAALADGSARVVSAAAEKRLRSFEERVLGAGHAAEHASARRTARRAQAARRRDARRLRSMTPDRRRSIVRQRQRAARAATLTATASAGSPAQVGQWAPAFANKSMGVHAAMLPTGKVMYFAYPVNGVKLPSNENNTAQAWLWDPAKGTGDSAWKRVDPPLWRDPSDGRLKPANIWCAGQSFLADGRLLVAGGNLRFPDEENGVAYYRGLDKVYTFNPFNETWTEQPDMDDGRWYPTQVLMSDGRTAIVDGLGSDYDYIHNDSVEIFTPSADLDGRGRITKLAAERGEAGEPPHGETYPHVFQMPSGRVLFAGPSGRNGEDDFWSFTLDGNDVFAWRDEPNASVSRISGSAVLTPGDRDGSSRVMQLGGADAASTASTEVFDENERNAGWQPAASMNVARTHLNTVLLPDGSMVSVGGGRGYEGPDGMWTADASHKPIEIFDPATNSWRLGPPQKEKRTYHSTALLLPDGRVASAGDDYNGPNDSVTLDSDTIEVYSPAYLFKGERPTISAAPGRIAWNQTFGVRTPNRNIARASLVGLGAVTHSVDMGQRLLQLPVTQAAQGVLVGAPTDPAAAPPGYYMLFLIDDKGVPSTARFVRLGAHGDAIDVASSPVGVQPPAPQPEPQPGSQQPPPSTVKPAAKPLTLRMSRSASTLRFRRGAKTVRVRVLALDRSAALRFTLRNGRKTYATGSARARARRSISSNLRVTKAGRRALRRRSSLSASLRVVARPIKGETVTRTFRVRMRVQR